MLSLAYLQLALFVQAVYLSHAGVDARATTVSNFERHERSRFDLRADGDPCATILDDNDRKLHPVSLISLKSH